MVEVDSMDIVAKLSVPICEDKELDIPAIFAPAVGQMMYCPEIELEEELLELLEDDENEELEVIVDDERDDAAEVVED